MMPYWYFLDSGYKYEPELCNSCYDILMMAYELENIAILNMKGVDYRCVISNTSEYDAIDRLDNFKIDDKGSL